MHHENETARLEKIGAKSSYAAGVNTPVAKFSYKSLRHYVKGRILELGPAEGIMTTELVEDGHTPILVEGSASLAKLLKQKFPNLTVESQLFEIYKSEIKFDTIIMGHVLEHVEDPVSILKRYHSMLNLGGVIWASVPNANSLHRQAAVHMGLLKNVQTLNDADLRHGHRRVLNPEEFREIFSLAGLDILEFGGYWLKPLSNSQIEKEWTSEMIEAFCELGKSYPEISGEMFIVAKSRFINE